ncbi:hypothetical protein CHCC14814_2877 [Bacillus paralicheniformis]|nr:hypothetical protein CHCC14814_2877 [Bacillus paralicheniformis]
MILFQAKQRKKVKGNRPNQIGFNFFWGLLFMKTYLKKQKL